MRQHSVIRRSIAFLLLLVFLVSAAHKAYFHNAIASHRDGVFCSHPEPASYCLHQQPFNCHFDELVVTAPFLMESCLYSFTVLTTYPGQSTDCRPSSIRYFATQKISRGPPAA